MAKLRVHRTAIGFYDAYVAAPSQKAALTAWGTNKPLFARGAAEVVTDPALTEEALATPGKVIKRLRGTRDEQIAALPDTPEPKRAAKGTQTHKLAPKKPRQPKPSKADLVRAEQALDEAEADFRQQRDALDLKIKALQDERERLEADHAKARQDFEQRRDDAADAYQAAMRRWERSP